METQEQQAVIARLNDRFRGMCLDVVYTSGIRGSEISLGCHDELRHLTGLPKITIHTAERVELETKARVIVDKMRLMSSLTAIKYMEEDLAKIE